MKAKDETRSEEGLARLTRRQFLRATGVATVAATGLPAVLAADQSITVALVGCAHIHTASYVGLLTQREDVTVKFVWDHDAARANKYARQLEAKAVADLDQIWSDPAVTAVVICSETNRHRDLVLAAARAGKHLFVEKPLGITAQESREMADAIERANRLFTTGYFMRSDPKHIFLRAEIARGAFGMVTRARGSNCHNGSLGGWFDKEFRWMADPSIAGFGGFGDLGTHKLDILMWLLGDVEAVSADLRAVTHRYGECDETGEGLLQFQSGIIATLGAGWVDVADPVQLMVSGTTAHAVVINGQLFYQNAHVPGADGKEPFKHLPPAPREPIQQFLDAVAGKQGEPLVTPREAAARVAVMEALYRASSRRAWVKPA
ncbi:MAG: Gfo/Idh/MocA family oxidoreductase [Verrucomicrobia bacterium]|nr:Gfo/Idh/MocA family oxidoreductase [Verrucomicrobiota bacterium]